MALPAQAKQTPSLEHDLPSPNRRNKLIRIAGGFLGVAALSVATTLGIQHATQGGSQESARSQELAEAPIEPEEGEEAVPGEVAPAEPGTEQEPDASLDTVESIIPPDTPPANVAPIEGLIGLNYDSNDQLILPQNGQEIGVTDTQLEIAIARSYIANPEYFDEIVQRVTGETLTKEQLLDIPYQGQLSEELLYDYSADKDIESIVQDIVSAVQLGVLIEGHNYDPEAIQKEIELNENFRLKYHTLSAPDSDLDNARNYLLPAVINGHQFFSEEQHFGLDGLAVVQYARKAALRTEELGPDEADTVYHAGFELIDADYGAAEILFTEDGIDKSIPFEPGGLQDKRLFGYGPGFTNLKIPNVTIVYDPGLVSVLAETTPEGHQDTSGRRVFNGDLIINVQLIGNNPNNPSEGVHYTWLTTNPYTPGEGNDT
jgi:hypothetical protein